jgi:hypothetical protein
MASTISSSPKSGRVYWTAYTELEGTSQPTDPLRFDMYTERLGNLLLPGLTNRTIRLRYLSMVCAGIAITGRGHDLSVSQQRRAFLPFERGWALAMTVSARGELKATATDGSGSRRLKPKFRGLRGANRVLAHYRTVAYQPRMKPTAYVLLKGQDSQGGLGAYLVTLREFGFVQPDSITLTAAGEKLASAFDQHLWGAPLSALADPGLVKRRTLERLGGILVLGAPSGAERRIVREAIFGRRGGVVADCVHRALEARPDSRSPRDLLGAIARRDGDPVERYAQYAVDFDPLRIALLQLFARIGQELRDRAGFTPVDRLLSEPVKDAATRAQSAARRLTGSTAPGLEPVSRLASDLASSASVPEAIATLIAFHRQEGRAWITSDRADRYAIGQPGPFEEPGNAFHGYTMSSALSLLADARATA